LSERDAIRVLLYERRAALRSFLVAVLQPAGYEIRVADDLAAVYRAAMSGEADLLLTHAWGTSQRHLTAEDRATYSALHEAIPLVLTSSQEWAIRALPGTLPVPVVPFPCGEDQLLAAVAEAVRTGRSAGGLATDDILRIAPPDERQGDGAVT
jgi:DNA-binding response OmpR family regulator